MKEQIIICMPLKNAEKTLKKSVYSVLKQIKTKREIVLLVGNDNSIDNSMDILNDIANEHSNIVILNVNFNSTYLNRNFLNNYVRVNFPNCALIGRLDADDTIINETAISQIEKLFDKYNFDALMSGNKQIKNGAILQWENHPSKDLIKDDFLSKQLYLMAKGNTRAELPSCNTFIKPSVTTEYPNKKSAEDHWFSVFLLMQKKKLNIYIDEQLLYCVYSLDGFVTNDNKKTQDYTQSRIELYNFFKNKMKNR